MVNLEGFIEMHVHGSPDVVPRKLSDLEIAKDAVQAKMYAVVLKSHLGSTVARAELVNEAINHQIKVLGGIALNSFIGDWNTLALKTALHMGAKIVWMPTFTAKNHLDFERREGKAVNALSALCTGLKGLTIFDEQNKIKKEVYTVLEIMGDNRDIPLCFGHLGLEEVRALVPLAHKKGI